MILKLQPGRPPRDAAEELRRQAISIRNVLTAGHTSQDVLREYLLWAVRAERMLRNHFTATTIAELIFTQRYWALQTSGTNNWELAGAMVEAEIAEREERLHREEEHLAEAQTRWMRGHLVVPDTSAVIHGTKLWEWEPATDLGLRDHAVQIVVPMLVLDELDALKEHPKQHTRNRSRQTLKWIAGQLGASQSFLVRKGSAIDGPNGPVVRGDVYLDVLIDDPGHVRLPIADDEIVDRGAALASISGRDVTLVTNDTSQGYRAQIAGLNVSMIVDPVYDIDIQVAAKEADKDEKVRKVAERRARQEAQRGRRDPKGNQSTQDTDPEAGDR